MTEEVKPNVEEVQPEPSFLEQVKSERALLEKVRDENTKLLGELRELRAQDILSGKADKPIEQKPKEYSPKEYIDLLLQNKIPEQQK